MGTFAVLMRLLWMLWKKIWKSKYSHASIHATFHVVLLGFSSAFLTSQAGWRLMRLNCKKNYKYHLAAGMELLPWFKKRCVHKPLLLWTSLNPSTVEICLHRSMLVLSGWGWAWAGIFCPLQDDFQQKEAKCSRRPMCFLMTIVQWNSPLFYRCDFSLGKHLIWHAALSSCCPTGDLKPEKSEVFSAPQ